MSMQLAAKTQELQQLLAPFVEHTNTQFLPPVVGEDQGFRNKAKMVVLGAAHAPGELRHGGDLGWAAADAAMTWEKAFKC